MITDYGSSLESRRAGRARRLRRSLALAAATVAMALLGLASAAAGSSQRPTRVVVNGGETLWGIVAAHYPNDDVRSRLSEVMDENHLSWTAVHAGETLTLP